MEIIDAIVSDGNYWPKFTKLEIDGNMINVDTIKRMKKKIDLRR